MEPTQRHKYMPTTTLDLETLVFKEREKKKKKKKGKRKDNIAWVGVGLVVVLFSVVMCVWMLEPNEEATFTHFSFFYHSLSLSPVSSLVHPLQCNVMKE